jgi:hypothetical protein
MVTVRRWYTYLVCAISLQSIAWAIIALLRNMLQTAGRPVPAAVAFQIAVIIVGLPLFLAHWLWVQRLLQGDSGEQESDIRRLYLYFMKAAFLWPLAAQAYYLLSQLLTDSGASVIGRNELHHFVPVLVLSVFWFYHYRLVKSEAEVHPFSEVSAVIRRVYMLGFSLAGLVMIWVNSHRLLEWIFERLSSSGQSIFNSGMITNYAVALLVGLAVWLVFWNRVQKLYQQAGPEEVFSALRKFYLYLIVFFGALFTVGSLVLLLSGVFRRLLGLPPGDLKVTDLLPLILVSGVIWAYHAYILKTDGQKAEEAPRQAGIRRLYNYLISAIGLFTFLSGTSMVLIVLVRLLGREIFGDDLREMVAAASAGLAAGLPVWLIPWRPAQNLASQPGPAGKDERRSVVRKIYLYLFLFAATLMVLSSLVFIVYRVVGMALGETRPTFTELGQAISLTLIGTLVWMYHISLIRQDNQLLKEDAAQKMTSLRVAVLDMGQQSKGLILGLEKETPGLLLNAIQLREPVPLLTPEEAAQDDAELAACLEQSEVVLVPWPALLDSGVGSILAASPVRKLLLPFQHPGWDFVGFQPPDQAALVKQASQAIKQMMAGEAVQPHRPLGVGAIVGIVLLVIFLLTTLVPLIAALVVEFL